MIRPYVCVGITMIISLAIFNLLGFYCAAVFAVMSICLTTVLLFIKKKNKIISVIFTSTLSVLIASSAFCIKTASDYLPATLLCSDTLRTISGELYEYEFSDGTHYYTLKNASINGYPTEENIRICSKIYRNVDIDDTLTFTDATIYELGASNGNAATYKADGIYLGAYTTEDFTVSEAEKHSINFYLNEIRKYISSSLSVIGNDNYSAIGVAMLTGDQSKIDSTTLLNFRYSGIAHLFAVSGFHLTLWTSAISILFTKIFKNKKQLSALLSIIFVIFFMALTGFSKSVLRAGIMLIITLFGRLIKRRADSLNSLFLSITVILLINPYSIMSVSLQLSFLATLGIILLSKSLSEPCQKDRKQVKYKTVYKIRNTAYASFIISVIAALFTIPVSAVNFGYISLLTPVTNVLCVPAAEITMILSAVAVVCSPIAAISKPALTVSTLLIRYIIFITEKIANLKYSIVDTSSPVTKIVFLSVITVMLVLLIVFRKNSKQSVRVILASSAAILILSVCTFAVEMQSVKVTTVDVGNGTSIVMNIKGKRIIIGCGGSAYKEYRLTNTADSNTMSYDLIILPREKDTEAGYIYTMLGRYTFNSCITHTGSIPSYIIPKLPSDTYVADYSKAELDENTNLIYINNDDFTGVRIESGSFTCTVIFKPSADFSAVDDEWKSGSLLISRQALPQIELSDFENIIVSSSSDLLYTNDNIYSTNYSGNIVYRLYPNSITTITEENNDYK